MEMEGESTIWAEFFLFGMPSTQITFRFQNPLPFSLVEDCFGKDPKVYQCLGLTNENIKFFLQLLDCTLLDFGKFPLIFNGCYNSLVNRFPKHLKGSHIFFFIKSVLWLLFLGIICACK